METTNFTSKKSSEVMKNNDAPILNTKFYDPDVYEAAQTLMKLNFDWQKEAVTNLAHKHTATISQPQQSLLFDCDASTYSSPYSKNQCLSSHPKRNRAISFPAACTNRKRHYNNQDAPILMLPSAKHHPVAEPPIIQERFRDKIESMGGKEIQYLITKCLEGSDIDKPKNRLMLPMKQIKTKFLKEEEMSVLQTRVNNSNNLKAVRSHLVEPDIQNAPSFINLKVWNVHYYVLVTEWHQVVCRNKLKMGESVQVWCFRVGEDLGFTLIRV